jgi:hypothetical protein
MADLNAFNYSTATVAQMVAATVAILTPSCVIGANTYLGSQPSEALTCDGKWNDGAGIAP